MSNDILNSIIRGAREVMQVSTRAAKRAAENMVNDPAKSFKLTAVATGASATLMYIGAQLENDGHCKLEDFLRQCGENETIVLGAREQLNIAGLLKESETSEVN